MSNRNLKEDTVSWREWAAATTKELDRHDREINRLMWERIPKLEELVTQLRIKVYGAFFAGAVLGGIASILLKYASK